MVSKIIDFSVLVLPCTLPEAFVGLGKKSYEEGVNGVHLGMTSIKIVPATSVLIEGLKIHFNL